MSKPMTHQKICEEWEAVSRAQNANHRRGLEAAIKQCRQFLAAIQQNADEESGIAIWRSESVTTSGPTAARIVPI